MITWDTDPVFLADQELLRAYQATDGESQRAEDLLAEIERRRLDV